jgi:hypothetical protein
MNANAKKWVEALRSGNYKQGKGCLTNVKATGNEYCCLGVACDVYQKEVGSLKLNVEDNNHISYDNEAAYLPPKVREWLGLRTGAGIYGYPSEGKDLTRHNDADECTFNEIANIIESQPKGLFNE